MLVNGSQDIKLKCDTERIIQVINNLMSNSLKFVPSEKGKIEIGTRLENESVIFNVRDNGVGIPKDKQDNLFKKFYQIDTSLGRRSGGSGLGLVICKGIVESHNGKMWVESEPGIETTFYFLIPRGVT
jgi:signal transduction histidine kinase